MTVYANLATRISKGRAIRRTAYLGGLKLNNNSIVSGTINTVCTAVRMKVNLHVQAYVSGPQRNGMVRIHPLSHGRNSFH